MRSISSWPWRSARLKAGAGDAGTAAAVRAAARNEPCATACHAGAAVGATGARDGNGISMPACLSGSGIVSRNCRRSGLKVVSCIRLRREPAGRIKVRCAAGSMPIDSSRETDAA